MKRTRGLWASIIFVLVLVTASLAALLSGAISPTLGLDLEGGVSVILSAPPDTPPDVMNRTLENIRNRVDAFGVGEPDIVQSGTTIEVQIPGSADATVEQRPADLYCLNDETQSYGCAETEQDADEALDSLEVIATPSQVCLNDPDGAELDCFGTAPEAEAAKASLTVAPKGESGASESASASASPSEEGPAPAASRYCIVDTSGAELACYGSRQAAEQARKGVTTEVTDRSYCVTEKAPEPEKTPPPSPSASSSDGASDTASPSASPAAFTYGELDRENATDLPCSFSSKPEAQDALAAITVEHVDSRYCVISSADENLGCYVERDDAQARQRETGQQRLLSVIGQTARLEERQVLEIIDPTNPAYASTAVTCSTPEERASDACSAGVLANKDVVYLGETNDNPDVKEAKFHLGPVIISGEDIKRSTAVIPQAQWEVQFELTGSGSDRFGAETTRVVNLPPPQNQIAIVVDRAVISNPEVQSPITGGVGQITGGFSEQEAKDLATQLNSGALPVELTRQSVTTVSPTLGRESLDQGIIAGVAGLILLFLYLLFYYRLLGVVAWLGMSIWAILAIALVSIAGTQFGYALTLAGVAGLVISLGVTADSYIVFFERLKDEVRGGRSARSAVQPAFARAFKTIVAADIVTGIAAAVLYLTAVSSVRGFALTLGVATLLDLFVVYFFKRPTVFLIARNQRLVNLRGFGLASGVAAEEHGGVPAPAAEGSAP